jgi:hypothetical protein
MDWYELAKAYPPAMQSLKEIRDAAEKQVIKGQGNAKQAFQDVSAINEKLGDEARTVNLFVQLDNKSPSLAKVVYIWAQPSLVRAKRFDLCGKYLTPATSYSRMVEQRRLALELVAEEPGLTAERRHLDREFAEQFFLQESGALIALLVLNDRKPTAEKLAEEVLKESKHSARESMVHMALKGRIPTLAPVSDEK